mmetsp:Transcript_13615/g.21398  ORF Transcript_13615/g.21398 Transcript_13615/m.21398 type:complete len:425 (-) Transcript_13615:147-1421(-)
MAASAETQDNRYIDTTLLHNVAAFSATANKKFVPKLPNSKPPPPPKKQYKLGAFKRREKNQAAATATNTTTNESKYNQEEEKEEEQVFEFPATIATPPEALEFSKWYNYDGMDAKIEQYLLRKYEQDITSLPHFYDDIVIRFVIGYRHVAKTAQDFNKRAAETEKLFKEYLVFHKRTNFDRLLATSPVFKINNVEIKQYVAGMYVYGADKFGHPLLWDEGAKYRKDADLSLHRHCGQVEMDTVLSYIIRLLHELKIATNQHYGFPVGIKCIADHVHTNTDEDSKTKDVAANSNKGGDEFRQIGVYRHCIIFDMKGFSSKRVLKDIKIHEYYTKRGSFIAPDIVHRVYVINAPVVFLSVWKMLKGFLHPNTVEKTLILGKDYLPQLLKEIDIHMIPPRFGGKGQWQVNDGDIPPDYPIQLSHLQR